ncbi:MAG: ATP-binding protein [Limnobacter sp.]|nr:ATP-binding protein [Limnobacter sp.]
MKANLLKANFEKISLFWRFFLGFWVCLIGAALATTAVHRLLQEEPTDLELNQGPRAQLVMDAAAVVLQTQGADALATMLERRVDRGGKVFPLYVVNVNNKELLGRVVPEELKAGVQAAFSASVPGTVVGAGVGAISADRPRPAGVQKVLDPSGKPWVLFVARGPRPAGGPGAESKAGMKPGGLGAPPPFGPAWMLIGFLFASFVFAWFLARRFSSPFASLRAGFQQVADGKLDTRIAQGSERHDEVGQLLSGFDKMAAQLQSQMNQQKALLHDVSHELRSPLARLNMATGLARQNPQNTQKLEECLNRVETEAERLDHLIGQLLRLSRLQSDVKPEFSRHNVIELLGNLIEDAQFEAEQSGKRVRFDCDVRDWTMMCNPDALHSAFENGVRNAIRHTPQGTEVRVSCLISSSISSLTTTAVKDPSKEAPKEHLLIRIEDEGGGLPEPILEKLFAPFFKMGSHRGHGLGLAILKKAIELHQGKVSAFNSKPHNGGQGLVLEFVLPRG